VFGGDAWDRPVRRALWLHPIAAPAGAVRAAQRYASKSRRRAGVPPGRPAPPDRSNLDRSNPGLTNPDLTNPDLTNPDLTSGLTIGLTLSHATAAG
jgi:hypothetical protein